jgi:endonuclease YncB( thermonuclease family)
VIAAGWARADGSGSDLRDAETLAHAARAGLWGANGGGASF